jgi:hypothetical protein
LDENTGDTIITPVARTEAKNHIIKNSPFSISDWRAQSLRRQGKPPPQLRKHGEALAVVGHEQCGLV